MREGSVDNYQFKDVSEDRIIVLIETIMKANPDISHAHIPYLVANYIMFGNINGSNFDSGRDLVLIAPSPKYQALLDIIQPIFMSLSE